MSEIRELLDILKRHLEQRGGSLPNPADDPRFYERILNLMDMAKEEGSKITLKSIAEELGVSYANLRKNISTYRKMSQKHEINYDYEDNVEIEKPLDTSTQVKEEVENIKKDKTEQKPITGKVETRLYDKITLFLGRKAEELAKEEVIEIIDIGKTVIEKYKKSCLANGFDDMKECIDAAFTSLFELAPKHIQLQEKYDSCLGMLSELMKATDPYLKIVKLIHEASKSCDEGIIDIILSEAVK